MARSSSHKIKNICVFCGSSPGKDKEFLEVANHLGKVLAERKIHLVYGGGSIGLMVCVSIATFIGGSQVLGIIPKALTEGSITGKTVGEELKVLTMHERIQKMLDHSDAFIALPRGIGTLEEIFQIASWAQLKIHQKPISLLNVNGFFNGLLSFLDHVVEQKFISDSSRQIFISAITPEQLIDQLQIYVPEVDPAIT
ncbi:Cytokinin riboside 5'-monophosphate phosphoribohydrolase [Parasponia andersonii]|uniref:Cytokinin riboside 5'-monophosphate phosphoribohydrolase n=1 Tax=Parasponia andersonii TaxID=3476 RepID=A0A2P5BST6_PARAD|nr:Cytokinin riboside 5'-monophosphate phosphoribohydrolase [Parasponia andersonii]